MTQHEWQMSQRLYAGGGTRTTEDGAIAVRGGECVGGGTTVNVALCLDPVPRVWEGWRRDRGLTGFSFDRDGVRPRRPGPEHGRLPGGGARAAERARAGRRRGQREQPAVRARLPRRRRRRAQVRAQHARLRRLRVLRRRVRHRRQAGDDGHVRAGRGRGGRHPGPSLRRRRDRLRGRRRRAARGRRARADRPDPRRLAAQHPPRGPGSLPRPPGDRLGGRHRIARAAATFGSPRSARDDRTRAGPASEPGHRRHLRPRRRRQRGHRGDDVQRPLRRRARVLPAVPVRAAGRGRGDASRFRTGALRADAPGPAPRHVRGHAARRRRARQPRRLGSGARAGAHLLPAVAVGPRAAGVRRGEARWR